MEIIYRANDGEIFYNQEACLKHEAETAGYYMFTWKGEPTTNPENATLVHLELSNDDDDEVASAKAFIELCENTGLDCEGIGVDDAGWFYYNGFTCTYNYIDGDVVDAIRSIPADIYHKL